MKVMEAVVKCETREDLDWFCAWLSPKIRDFEEIASAFREYGRVPADLLPLACALGVFCEHLFIVTRAGGKVPKNLRLVAIAAEATFSYDLPSIAFRYGQHYARRIHNEA